MKPKKASSNGNGKTSKVSAVEAKPKRAPVKRKAAAPSASPELPPFLLEGDQPSAPGVSGPGEKFALGPVPPAQDFTSEEAELPSAYGTKRLFLTARDPHWLYAHWDLTTDQQKEYNTLSADKHLVLRIFSEELKGKPVSEIHVHPESKHWFVHVEESGSKYFCELGYYRKSRDTHVWTKIAVSGATLTPPDSVSSDTSIAFATIPVEVPFERLVALVRDAAREHKPLAQALEDLQRSTQPQLPANAARANWTPAQERALAEVISMDEVRRVWIGSLEITELIRRRIERELSSMGVMEFGAPTSPFGGISSITSLSSPFGGARPGAKGFWFNVNAELIIYGATEPDATVTIGGRQIKLRPDGSFSYRFALPDGRYEMPAVAVSADGTDARAAELMFTRTTEFRGDVGTHPQDPSLKTPTPENV